ncbi:Probable magnesium transporter NIPA8 [Durusdinium trenchii]|uniref:Probable magnesium transporter NIPA8 n=1 Tax=Durusdinium trenchii TaxID=1381693 RepID=A0ABP0MTK7_9DINO
MSDNEWIIGVAFSFASSVLSCLGLIFQKYAHNQNQALPDDEKWPVVAGIVCSPCWWASFIMMGLFPFPFDFFAYSFAAQSLVAPFAGLTLIMNQFFAPLILKEKIHRIDLYAAVIVFAGCTLTTVSGNHDSETYVLDDLLEFFRRTEFVAGALTLSSLMLLMICSLYLTDPLRKEDGEGEVAGEQGVPNVDKGKAASDSVDDSASDSASASETDSGARASAASSDSPSVSMAGILPAARTDDVHVDLGAGSDSNTDFHHSAAELTKPSIVALMENDNHKQHVSVSLDKSSSNQAGQFVQAESKCEKAKEGFLFFNFRARPWYYGFIAGGFGGFQNVFFKSIGVLMKSSVFDDVETNAWDTFYPYVFIVTTLVLAILQLSFLNKGMARYDAILVFPLYNASYIFLSVVIGALYYGEFNDFSSTQWTLFPIGVITTMAGILLFILKPRENQSEAGKTTKATKDQEHEDEDADARGDGASEVVVIT